MSQYADQFELVDCPEQTIKCSDCNKPLMHFKVTIPNAPIEHKLQATCPFCGTGKSFVTNVKGDIVVGPIGRDESENFTVINDIITDTGNNVSLFEIKRGLK